MSHSVDKTMISFIINSEDLHPRLTVLVACKLFSFDSRSYRILVLGFHADSCFPVSPVLSRNAAKIALFGKITYRGKQRLTFSSFTLHDITYIQSFLSTHPHFSFKNQNYYYNLAHDIAQSWALGKTELIFKTQSPNSHKLQLNPCLCICLSNSRGRQRKPSWAASLTHGSTAATWFLHFLDAAASEPSHPLHNTSRSTEGLTCCVTCFQSKTILLHSPHLWILLGARKK